MTTRFTPALFMLCFPLIVHAGVGSRPSYELTACKLEDTPEAAPITDEEIEAAAQKRRNQSRIELQKYTSTILYEAAKLSEEGGALEKDCAKLQKKIDDANFGDLIRAIADRNDARFRAAVESSKDRLKKIEEAISDSYRKLAQGALKGKFALMKESSDLTAVLKWGLQKYETPEDQFAIENVVKLIASAEFEKNKTLQGLVEKRLDSFQRLARREEALNSQLLTKVIVAQRVVATSPEGPEKDRAELVVTLLEEEAKGIRDRLSELNEQKRVYEEPVSTAGASLLQDVDLRLKLSRKTPDPIDLKVKEWLGGREALNNLVRGLEGIKRLKEDQSIAEAAQPRIDTTSRGEFNTFAQLFAVPTAANVNFVVGLQQNEKECLVSSAAIYVGKPAPNGPDGIRVKSFIKTDDQERQEIKREVEKAVAKTLLKPVMKNDAVLICQHKPQPLSPPGQVVIPKVGH